MKRKVWFLGTLTLVLICACTLADAQPVTQALANTQITAPTGAIGAVPQPDGSVIFLHTLIAQVQPYVAAAIGLIITALAGIAVQQLNAWLATWSTIRISQKDLDDFDKSAQIQAGAWVAAATDGWQNASITASSPGIAAMANKVIERLPDAATRLGMTPEKMSDRILAKIGQMQLDRAKSPAAPKEGPSVQQGLTT